MVYLPPIRHTAVASDNPTRSPHDPASDPLNKTGATPPPQKLQEDARAQGDGRAVSSATRNANTPHANQPAKRTVRDWSVEHWTP